jgi:hypothetical protein
MFTAESHKAGGRAISFCEETTAKKKKKKVAEIHNRNVNANSFKQARTNFKTIINIIIIQFVYFCVLHQQANGQLQIQHKQKVIYKQNTNK